MDEDYVEGDEFYDQTYSEEELEYNEEEED